jgi:hypothetical protein
LDVGIDVWIVDVWFVDNVEVSFEKRDDGLGGCWIGVAGRR